MLAHLRMHQVSLEVAACALRDHIARTGDNLDPYRVTTTRGTLPPRAAVFTTMQDVRDDRHLRSGRMVSVNQAFRLQQWLAAESMIRERWPAHQSHVVSRHLLAGLKYEGLPLFSFLRLPRRRR